MGTIYKISYYELENNPNFEFGEKVIKPIEKINSSKIKRDTFVRKTNFANHEIYIINHLNSPNALLEIGKLRELTFKWLVEELEKILT